VESAYHQLHSFDMYANTGTAKLQFIDMHIELDVFLAFYCLVYMDTMPSPNSGAIDSFSGMIILN